MLLSWPASELATCDVQYDTRVNGMILAWHCKARIKGSTSTSEATDHVR
jgi:hypothetical protein